MKQLKEYIYENINEGIIKGVISLSFIKKISPEDLLNGIMNMYEYICNNEDIELFFQDFQFKERVFWKNLYEMYTKKVWSIFDMNDNEKLKVVLIGGFSEGKTSIAAAWLGKYDPKTMNINQQYQ